MVQELTKMISERLIAYQKKMEQLPERIIIFRIKVSKVSHIIATRSSLSVLTRAQGTIRYCHTKRGPAHPRRV